MLLQAGRSLGKTLIAVKENIIFQAMCCDRTVTLSWEPWTRLYCHVEKGKFWAIWCLWILPAVTQTLTFGD